LTREWIVEVQLINAAHDHRLRAAMCLNVSSESSALTQAKGNVVIALFVMAYKYLETALARRQ
jgi:hypothetical protein